MLSIRAIAVSIMVGVFASCSVPPRDMFGQPRVTEQEIAEITPVIHKQTYNTSETITGFYRYGVDAVQVYTDSETVYIVRKVNGRWKITETSSIEY